MRHKNRIRLSRFFLLGSLVCLMTTIVSLVPDGESALGGLFWLGSHVFLLLALITLIFD